MYRYTCKHFRFTPDSFVPLYFSRNPGRKTAAGNWRTPYLIRTTYRKNTTPVLYFYENLDDLRTNATLASAILLDFNPGFLIEWFQVWD